MEKLLPCTDKEEQNETIVFKDNLIKKCKNIFRQLTIQVGSLVIASVTVLSIFWLILQLGSVIALLQNI